MLALALGASLLLQDPQPPKNPPAEPTPAAEREVVPDWDKKTARSKVKEFEKRLKGRKVSLKSRMDALEILAGGRSDQLVKPISNLMLKDDSLLVCVRAAEVLAQQPEKAAKPTICRLLATEKFDKKPAVQAALVRALSGCGYASRDWQTLDGLFDKDFGPERTDLQKAILRLVIEHEELQALDFLVEHIGEPMPDNPDDPLNPPAEYWERRWKAWEVWKEDVKAAMLKLTGQRFSTRKEAKVWLKRNRSKLERERRKGGRRK